MKKAFWYTVGMGIILLGVSLIIKEIIIPIGEQALEALYGSLIVLGVIAVFGLMMWGIGALLKKEEVQEAVVKGGIFMAAVGVLLWILGKFMKSFAKNAKEVYKLNGNKAFGPVIWGGLLIVSIIGVMGLILYGIGELIGDNWKQKGLSMLKGGVAAVAIGFVALLIGREIRDFAESASAIYDFNKGNAVIKGGEIVVLVLGVLGTIMAILGSFGEEALIVLGVGAAILGLIGLTADILSGEIWLICKIARDVFDMNKDKGLEKGFDLMLLSVGKVGELALKLAGMFLLIAVGAIAEAVAVVLLPVIGATNLMVNFYMDIMHKLKNVSTKDLE